jgi:hypothetical protein
MPDEQFKRHIAYKLRIGDILVGKPVFDAERFAFLVVYRNLFCGLVENLINV